MTKEDTTMSEEGRKDTRPRINFRPLLFGALGLILGIFFYFRIRFGGLRPSDFCLPALLFFLALFPLGWKRLAVLICTLAVMFGVGVGLSHLRTERYLSGAAEGRYAVSGTVTSFVHEKGYMRLYLDDLTFDGAPMSGTMYISAEIEEARSGDILFFEANVYRYELPASESDSQTEFCEDVRYRAWDVEYTVTGKSKDPFLRVKAALYDSLQNNMGGNEADIAFALLTGDSRGMDSALLEEVRASGIAHIFAVSGLHIGLLFGAVYAIFVLPLRRKALIPALACAFLYTALCGFTVSATRALIMCAIMGGARALFRKYDFLGSVSAAALITLLIAPSDFLSVGFRLSFGACLGLALLAGPLARLFARIRLPKFLAGYLSANLAVQLVTFPILFETFGYFSVWGFLFNFILIPILPALFLPVLLFSFAGLIIPPAAGALMFVPKSILSLLVYLYAAMDVSFVLKGFALGMGGLILLISIILLSDRVRMERFLRAFVGAACALLLTLSLLFENVVFTGVRIAVYAEDEGAAALIRSRSEAVLVIDGDIGLSDLERFLGTHYGGQLDGVFVISHEELAGINRAAFLNTACVYAAERVETGLQRTPLAFGDADIGVLSFRYLSRGRLLLEAEDLLVEFDFDESSSGGADYFVSGREDLIIFLKDGIMKL